MADPARRRRRAAGPDRPARAKARRHVWNPIVDRCFRWRPSDLRDPHDQSTFRYASKLYWEALRPIYTAPTAEAAWAAFEAFEESWANLYPAIGKLWRSSWQEFIPFLAYDVEIRRVLCSTNAIESLNARYPRAVTAKVISGPSRPP